MCDDGGACGGGSVGLGERIEAREEHIDMLDELRILSKAAREREIRDEWERLRRLQVLVALSDERAGLESEIKLCDAGAAVNRRGPLSDTESEELSFLHSCIALKRARVNELGLQMSEIQLFVRKLTGVVRLQEQRAEKDALQAEVNRGSAACAKKDALRAEVLRRSAAERLSALNVSAAAQPKEQCPDDGIFRPYLALTISSTRDGGDTCEVKVQSGEVIREVTVQGGEVIGEEVKVREESDGAGEQQQPQRQQQPQQPRPQQQQQDQVGPMRSRQSPRRTTATAAAEPGWLGFLIRELRIGRVVRGS